jgi:hypothetical protein
MATGRAIRELPVAERPRERLLLRGAAGLSAAELIGLLWGSGSRGRSAVDLATGSSLQILIIVVLPPRLVVPRSLLRGNVRWHASRARRGPVKSAMSRR